MPRTKKPAKKLEKTDKLKAPIFNLKGEVIEQISLPEEVFGAKVNSLLLAQAVRVYLANQRTGTHSTKTRSEITGSTRKIYRQKGTGRARHGDIKAPIFIGGGVAHGPKPKDYSLNFPSKMKKAALISALSDKWSQGSIKIVKGLEKLPAKTREIISLLSKLSLNFSDKEKVLILTSGKMQSILLAARNIRSITTLPVSILNTYEVLSHNNLLMTSDAITDLNKRLMPQKIK